MPANIRARILSSILLAPPIAALIWLGGIWTAALIYGASAIAAMEWWRAGEPHNPTPPLAIHIAALTISFLFLYPSSMSENLQTPALMLIIAATSAAALLAKNQWNALGIPLLIVPPAILLAFIHDNPAHILAFLAVILASDSAAFIAGKIWGRRQMAPQISPAKSWEGAAGGLAGAVMMALLCAYILNIPNPVPAAISVGLLLGVAAQAGDLLISFVKRRWGVKDSGSIIPGHGGILDRMDSVLLAALLFPFTFPML